MTSHHIAMPLLFFYCSIVGTLGPRRIMWNTGAGLVLYDYSTTFLPAWFSSRVLMPRGKATGEVGKDKGYSSSSDGLGLYYPYLRIRIHAPSTFNTAQFSLSGVGNKTS